MECCLYTCQAGNNKSIISSDLLNVQQAPHLVLRLVTYLTFVTALYDRYHILHFAKVKILH